MTSPASRERRTYEIAPRRRRSARGLGGRWALALALALGVTLGAPACKKKEVVVRTADGKGLSAEEIDAAPQTLLPSSPVALGRVECAQIRGTPQGAQFSAALSQAVAIPPAADFVPDRDLDRVVFGVYSMQGVDVAGVAVGRFDRARLAEAWAASYGEAGKDQYAGFELYLVRDVGFSVLTDHVAIWGNETGLRRTLDRIEAGRVEDAVPSWFRDLVDAPDIPLALAADFSTRPEAAAVLDGVAGLRGVQRGRLVGDFRPPGIQLAGTTRYGTEEQAAAGAAELARLREQLATWGTLGALFGIAQPVRQLTGTPRGNEVDVSLHLDLDATMKLLQSLSAKGAGQ